MASTSNIKIFSGTTSKYLSEKIAEAFGTKLGEVTMNHYSDGEYQPCLEESVRGAYVFIVQSTFTPADNLLELLLMIDSARRASAYKIAAVIPYFGFARQDRKDKPRVAIGSKLIANLLTHAGVDRVITMDLHAEQIQGFFDVPVDHLASSTIFVPFINSLKLENLVIASPDIGGSKRANKYSHFLQVPMVICHKYREKANEVAEMTIIGDVKGKNVIIVDDIIDTAGTLAKAADLMMNQGALSVRAIITHPVLSGAAYDRIMNSKLTTLYVTDTIPLKKPCPKIEVLSVAELFADVIKKVYNNQSISSSSYLK